MVSSLKGWGCWALADRARKEPLIDWSNVSGGGTRAELGMFDVYQIGEFEVEFDNFLGRFLHSPGSSIAQKGLDIDMERDPKVDA